MDGGKMSKSTGNILYADDLVEEFGVDPIRYFVLHETPYANDGIISKELIIQRYNSDLANTLGNLVNRTITMTHKYFDGVITVNSALEEIDNNLIEKATNLKESVALKINEIKVGEALELIIDFLRSCNKYIDDTTPWILAKEEDKKERLQTVLYNLLESIRISAVLLQAFIPDTAKEILKQLNTKEKELDSTSKFGNLEIGIKLNNPQILFERIVEDK
jgi:methionyl-tRNA synthetase